MSYWDALVLSELIDPDDGDYTHHLFLSTKSSLNRAGSYSSIFLPPLERVSQPK